MRAVAVCLFLFAIGASVAPETALAQQPPAGVVVDEVPDDVEVRPVAQVPTPKPGKGQALFFWLFAAVAVGGGLATITRKNAVSAVMFLVGTFMGIAALYALLYAHFIAVIQVLVYAGAIMVLFVFVVMILNKEEEEPWALRGLFGKVIAGLALIYLASRIIQILWNAAKLPMLREPETMAADFGTTVAVADTLFKPYLFPFEVISLILLIAVVGALVLAHPSHPNVGEEELQ
jgi:NADH-quinone oxidoreductase subunit J